MTRLSAMLCLGLAAGLLVACNSHDTKPSIDAGGWLLKLDVGEFSTATGELPLTVSIEAHLERSLSGEDAPDGTILGFTCSGGSFENGLREIEERTVDGRATASLMIEEEGSYEITVSFGDEKATAKIAITKGT